MLRQEWHFIWPYIVGYGFAVIWGHVCTYKLVRALWDTLGYKRGKDDVPHREQPMMLGMLERGLYVASWQFGKPEFIGVWLALKVAGQWNVWSGIQETHVAGHKIVGRNIFNVFLIGNGFSIAFGLVGALMLHWLSKYEAFLILPSIVVPMLLTLATFAFWLWAKYTMRRHS